MRENEYSLIDAVVGPEFFIAAADHINSVVNNRDRRKLNSFRQRTGRPPLFLADVINADLFAGRPRSVFYGTSTEDKNVLSDDGDPRHKDGKRHVGQRFPGVRFGIVSFKCRRGYLASTLVIAAADRV